MGAANCKSEDGILLCQSSEIPANGMKEVTVEGWGPVLLVRDAEGLHAVGAKCSHFGAKLINGALNTTRHQIRCPWHGACFDYRSGDMEDFPGLDSLPAFRVVERGPEVRLVHGGAEAPPAKRVRDMCRRGPADKDAPVVIVGAGAAGLSCAETLRQIGFGGRILLLTKEENLPYDRTKLSKAPNAAPDSLRLRSAEFLAKYDIEVKTGTEVVGVSPSERSVQLGGSDGVTVQSLAYRALLIATGGHPRKLDVKGETKHSASVFYLRTPQDGNRLAAACAGKDVLVVGSGFIGMELAAFLSDKAEKVTVLRRSGEPPFKPIFGAELGLSIEKLFTSKGVGFESGVVAELQGEGEILSSVLLKDGRSLPAQAVVVGIGVTPGVDWVDASVARDAGGFLTVDAGMKTSADGIWAAGDVAAFPLGLDADSFSAGSVNVQHWQMALKQGQTAAYSIGGQEKPIHSVPFFWSQMFGKSFRFAGFNRGWTSSQVVGSPDELVATVYFYNAADSLCGVATIGMDPVAAEVAELFALCRRISREDVQKFGIGSAGWKELLQKAA